MMLLSADAQVSSHKSDFNRLDEKQTEPFGAGFTPRIASRPYDCWGRLRRRNILLCMPVDTITLTLTKAELMSICLCIDEALEAAENKTVKHLAPEVIPRYAALAEKLWEALEGSSKSSDVADSSDSETEG